MRDNSSGDPAAQISAGAPLFRGQAIEYLSTQQYGTVLLMHPVSHRVLTLWFAFLAALVVAFICLFSTTRKTECQGVLLPSAGALRIVPIQAGTIMLSNVIEGQHVKAGDVLFILSSERSSAKSGSTQEVITRLLENRRDSFNTEIKQSQTQARQRLAAAREKATDFASESQHLDEQNHLQQQRLGLAEQAFKRYAELQATNYISAAQLQEKQAELLDQRQRLADIRRMQASARRNLADATATIRDLEIQTGRDMEALQRNSDSLQQEIAENEARREVLIRAPADGTIAAIAAVTGQTVGTGVTLASLLPAGSLLEAEVYAPSRAIGFIKPGMKVLLRYQAYPYQKFGQYSAVISKVASAALTPQELAIPGASNQASEPMYRIRVKLDKQTVQAYGRHIPLKSGMLVDASVVLEHRKLYEWILEPLFSISGRI